MSEFEKTGIGPGKRTAITSGFVLACAAVFGFLWVNAGGRVPVVSSGGYTVQVELPRAANLVYFADVMVAGIKAGKVTSVEPDGDRALVRMQLDQAVAPLHQGATVRVRAKSLVEESYLEITDGPGPTVPAGARLPATAGQEPTQLDDVLKSLDAPTRASLQRSLKSLGAGTAGTRDAVEATVVGLGDLGRQGRTVLDALSAQSQDLRDLTRSSARVLQALSTRRAALASLVESTDRLSASTAEQRSAIQETMRALPGVIGSARSSSDDLTRLGQALLPVAADLEAAAPDLTGTLEALPAAARDLRLSVPPLDAVLDSAPATLTRVPAVTGDVDRLLPDAKVLMSDLNPMLGYLEPYGRDVAAFFTNFAQTLDTGDAWGKYLKVMPPVNEQNIKGLPLWTNIGPLDRFNPLPLPGSLAHPETFGNRDYPRVDREPIPQ